MPDKDKEKESASYSYSYSEDEGPPKSDSLKAPDDKETKPAAPKPAVPLTVAPKKKPENRLLQVADFLQNQATFLRQLQE